MNKHDLTKAIRKAYGFSWNDCKGIIETILSTIKEGLKQGDKVILHGFGTLSVIKLTTKTFRDIRTGKIRTKLIKNKVKFKPSRNILKP